jgi:hypothetical protein
VLERKEESAPKPPAAFKAARQELHLPLQSQRERESVCERDRPRARERERVG